MKTRKRGAIVGGVVGGVTGFSIGVLSNLTSLSLIERIAVACVIAFVIGLSVNIVMIKKYPD